MDMPITWQQLAGLIEVVDIELEPINETKMIRSCSEIDHPSKQNSMFFTKEHNKERELIANSITPHCNQNLLLLNLHQNQKF